MTFFLCQLGIVLLVWTVVIIPLLDCNVPKTTLRYTLFIVDGYIIRTGGFRIGFKFVWKLAWRSNVIYDHHVLIHFFRVVPLIVSVGLPLCEMSCWLGQRSFVTILFCKTLWQNLNFSDFSRCCFTLHTWN